MTNYLPLWGRHGDSELGLSTPGIHKHPSRQPGENCNFTVPKRLKFLLFYIWGLDVIHRKFVIWSLTYLDILLHSGCEQKRFYSAHVSVLFSLKAPSFKRYFLNNVKNVAICPWLSWLKWNWHWLFEIVRWAEERGWHSPELIYNFQDLQILTFDQNWNRPRKLELSFSTLNVLNSAYIF